jgi:hypothetical protein
MNGSLVPARRLGNEAGTTWEFGVLLCPAAGIVPLLWRPSRMASGRHNRGKDVHTRQHQRERWCATVRAGSWCSVERSVGPEVGEEPTGCDAIHRCFHGLTWFHYVISLAMGVQLAPRWTAPVEVEGANQRLRLGRLVTARGVAFNEVQLNSQIIVPVQLPAIRSSGSTQRCVQSRYQHLGATQRSHHRHLLATSVEGCRQWASIRDSSIATRLSLPIPCFSSAHWSVKKRQARASCVQPSVRTRICRRAQTLAPSDNISFARALAFVGISEVPCA